MIFGALAAAGFSGSAWAQGAQPASADAPVAQPQGGEPSLGALAPTAPVTSDAADRTPAVAEVVVTGSLLRQPNLTATSPLTTVSNQEFKLQGATNVEDVLNTLPSVFASQNSGLSNGATGTATVDLRGLGANRTLVLIDGRRVGSSDPSDTGAVDLNLIPASLISRVDIVTGGASAIYGSDAIAGVVNFVMQHDFEGVRLDGNFEDFEHGNHNSYVEGLESDRGFNAPTGATSGGARIDVTAVIGANAPDGKGNVTAYLGYRHIDAVTQAGYDYSGCSLAESGKGYACSGSGTTTSARFITSAGDTYLDPKTNALRAYNSATDAYNYAPANYYQRPDTRYTAGFFAHYEINPKLEVYSDFMFMDDDSTAQIAPSGLFGQSFTIPCSNGMLTTAELSSFCGGGTAGSFDANILRRNVEGGDRQDILRHQEFRGVIGARGDLDNVWHYDVYAEMTQTTMNDESTGDISLSRAQAALSGCSSSYTSLTLLTGCTPYNIFSAGGVSQAALNYIEVDAFESSKITQQVTNATLTGDLGKYGLKSPWASDGLSVALGTEYRREALNLSVDTEYSSGDLAGAGGATLPVSGSYDVYELFGEMRAPLISDKPFVKDLSIDGAYRFSDYSTVGTTSTYSIEGNYSPSRDIRFRVSYNRAERAPNITELYASQTVTDGALTTDNCSGATPVYTAAQCARTGVTAAEYGNVTTNSAAQYNGMTGGNPDLKPEVANTYSGGIVFTPSFIPNLSVTLDYFNIFISGVIEEISAQNVLNDCATTGNSFDCSLVHRSSTGSLWLGTSGYVTDTLVNAGSLQTSGADAQVDYRWKIPQVAGHDLGRMSFDFMGTYLASYVSENVPGSGSKYDCAGFYGSTCGTPNPVWRHKFRATWTSPWNFDVSAQWRYIGSVRTDGDIANVGDTVYSADEKIPAISYMDLTVSMKIKDRYTFRVGCKNVFDQDPPIVGSNSLTGVYGNGNTFPGTYDVLGRNVFAGVTADF